MTSERVFTLAGGFLIAEGLLLQHRETHREHVFVFAARVLIEKDFDPKRDKVLTCSTFHPRWVPDHAAIVEELNKWGFKC